MLGSSIAGSTSALLSTLGPECACNRPGNNARESTWRAFIGQRFAPRFIACTGGGYFLQARELIRRLADQ